MSKPKVIAIWAQSIDGKIARNQNDSLDWVSKEDRKHFKHETENAGVIILGRTTYQQIGKPLPNRFNVILTTTPEKFTDIKGKLEFTSEPIDTLILSLHKRGYDTIFIAGGNTVYDQFFKKNLIDEIWITIEPTIIGKDGIAATTASLIDNFERTEYTSLNKSSILMKYQKT